MIWRVRVASWNVFFRSAGVAQRQGELLRSLDIESVILQELNSGSANTLRRAGWTGSCARLTFEFRSPATGSYAGAASRSLAAGCPRPDIGPRRCPSAGANSASHRPSRRHRTDSRRLPRAARCDVGHQQAPAGCCSGHLARCAHGPGAGRRGCQHPFGRRGRFRVDAHTLAHRVPQPARRAG